MDANAVYQAGRAEQWYAVGMHNSFMTAATKASLSSLLNGTARLLFVMAVVVFLFGGGAMHEFAKTEWMLAEIKVPASPCCWVELGQ
jgi:hypothetical protein